MGVRAWHLLLKMYGNAWYLFFLSISLFLTFSLSLNVGIRMIKTETVASVTQTHQMMSHKGAYTDIV